MFRSFSSVHATEEDVTNIDNCDVPESWITVRNKLDEHTKELVAATLFRIVIFTQNGNVHLNITVCSHVSADIMAIPYPFEYLFVSLL